MKAEKTNYPGVSYRVRANGEKIFYIRYRIIDEDGVSKLVEESLGSASKGMSAAKASNIRANKVTGKVETKRETRQRQRQRPADAPPMRWTIARLYDELKTTLNAENARRYEDVYFRFSEAFYDKTPGEITQLEIDAFRTRLLRDKSQSTARHALSVLSRIIRYGVKANLVEQPRLSLKPPKVDVERTESMDDDQLDRYLAALAEEKDVFARVFLLLALHTGMRKGALLRLKWEDVDFVRGFIILRGSTAKNKTTASIPMSAGARDALAQLSPREGYIFQSENGGHREDFRRVKERVKHRAGLPQDFRPLHGLRHTFASRIASSGEVDNYTLQKLMTHKDLRMTQRYAHLSDEAMKKAANVANSVMSRPQKNSC